MKNIILIILAITVIFIVLGIVKIINLKNTKYTQPEFLSGKKILIVYYSNIGNTKYIAKHIHSITGGNIAEIKLLEKYPSNIITMSKIVRRQMKEGYLPQIENIDITPYDIIFVGSPIWNFNMSLPTKAFLENNNFKNKIVVPFFTYSGGASKKKLTNQAAKSAQNAKILTPLFIFENGIFLAKEQVAKYLNGLKP